MQSTEYLKVFVYPISPFSRAHPVHARAVTANAPPLAWRDDRLVTLEMHMKCRVFEYIYMIVHLDIARRDTCILMSIALRPCISGSDTG